MKRAHIQFFGTVQGVGFRYTCQDYARALGLLGWVKNLADGSVELVIEGPIEAIENFIKNIEIHFDGFIRQKNVDYQDVAGHFTEFKIVF